MRWTEEIDRELEESWEERGDQSCGSFDEGWAKTLDVSRGAVSRARSRLGLVTRTVDTEDRKREEEACNIIRGVLRANQVDPDDLMPPPLAPLFPSHIETYDNVVEEYKSRFKKKQESAFRKHIEKQAQRDWIAEGVEDRAFVLDPPEKYVAPPESKRLKEEEICVPMGDIHIGSKTHKTYLDGLSDYSYAIFKRLLDQLQVKLHTLIKERQKLRKVPVLHFFLLGDIVEGEGIFRGQAHELDISILDQVLKGSRDIANFISYFSSLVPKIKVTCVPGNHGRISLDACPQDNWELLLYKSIEQYLEQHENVRVFTDRAYMKELEIQDRSILIMHGHQLKSTNNTSLEKFVGKYTLLRRTYYDCIIVGHWHTYTQRVINDTEMIIIPSFAPPSNYSVSRLGAGDASAQLVFGVEEEGITWRHLIPLKQ